MSENILEARNLSCSYGSTEVIIEANFAFKPGALIVVAGANGSGKTTLFRCLAGWSHAKSGEVIFRGQSLRKLRRQQKSDIAFVPDMPSFYDDLTAEEHLQFVLSANSRKEDYSEAESLLRDFGLYEYRKQFPSSYSRGMRQKLALVIALSLKPKLLLLDEPYGPLDYATSKQLSQQIQAIVGKGTTVAVSCHQQVPELKPDYFLLIQDRSVRLSDFSESDGWQALALLSPEECRDQEKQDIA